MPKELVAGLKKRALASKPLRRAWFWAPATTLVVGGLLAKL